MRLFVKIVPRILGIQDIRTPRQRDVRNSPEISSSGVDKLEKSGTSQCGERIGEGFREFIYSRR